MKSKPETQMKYVIRRYPDAEMRIFILRHPTTGDFYTMYSVVAPSEEKMLGTAPTVGGGSIIPLTASLLPAKGKRKPMQVCSDCLAVAKIRGEFND